MKTEKREQDGRDLADFLEKANTVSIIRVLYEKGEVMRSDLYEEVGKGVPTVYQRVNELIDLGLIEEEVLRVGVKKKMVKLTEKGRRIADLLERVEKVL